MKNEKGEVPILIAWKSWLWLNEQEKEFKFVSLSIPLFSHLVKRLLILQLYHEKDLLVLSPQAAPGRAGSRDWVFFFLISDIKLDYSLFLLLAQVTSIPEYNSRFKMLVSGSVVCAPYQRNTFSLINIMEAKKSST